MSSIELSKIYNSERVKYLVATQEISDALSKLKPYSLGVEKEGYVYAPPGSYTIIKVETDIEVLKKESRSIIRLKSGLFLPKFLLDREYIECLIDNLVEKSKEIRVRYDILLKIESAITNMLTFEEKNYRISEVLKSINFEHKTQKQMEYLFKETEEELKEDREGVIRAWLAYYPIKYTCYKVVL